MESVRHHQNMYRHCRHFQLNFGIHSIVCFLFISFPSHSIIYLFVRSSFRFHPFQFPSHHHVVYKQRNFLSILSFDFSFSFSFSVSSSQFEKLHFLLILVYDLSSFIPPLSYFTFLQESNFLFRSLLIDLI